jgi:hypothetical protein
MKKNFRKLGLVVSPYAVKIMGQSEDAVMMRTDQ